MKKKNSFLEKFKKLFIGKTTLKKRFFPAFLTCFALTFTLFLYGPLDLTYNGKNYINCTITELFPFCLKFWLITFFIFFLPSFLIGGKIHSFLVSAWCGLSLGFYIQANYLNLNLGSMDGNTIPWQNYGDNVIFNYMIWFLILLIPYLFHYFSWKTWRNFVLLASFALSVMQIVSLGSKVYDQIRFDRDSMNKKEQYGLSLADQYNFSPEKNVVVFFLDQTSEDEIHLTLEEYPDMLVPFHDFTCFDNMNTNYVGTFPALPHLLTMEEYDCEHEGFAEFFEKAWNSETAQSVYHELEENGWKTNLYFDVQYGAGSAANLIGKVTNAIDMENDKYTINQDAFRKLIKLSIFRYLPFGMKAPFWIYTADISSLKTVKEEFLTFDSENSVNYFWNHGIQVQGDENLFTLYHYLGSHAPYRMSSSGRFDQDNMRLTDQVAGYMYVIAEIMQNMKDLGIYDNATIIISTDHGDYPFPKNPQSIFYIKRAGEKHDEIQYSHAMISQENFLPTIVAAAGLDSSKYGKTVFDVSEDQLLERCVNYWEKDKNLAEVPGHKYNSMRRFCYIGDKNDLFEKINANDFTIHPLFDYFY